MASTVETMIRKTVGAGINVLADFNRRRLPELTTPHPFLSGHPSTDGRGKDHRGARRDRLDTACP